MIVFLLISASILGVPPVDGQGACTPAEVGVEALVGECAYYMECDGTGWFIAQCPPGEFFNSDTNACEFDNDGVCPEATDSSDLIPPPCLWADSHFQADITSCSSFSRVVDGGTREYRCAGGMVYNSFSSKCDWPDNYPTCNVPSETISLTPGDPEQCQMPCPSVGRAIYPMVTPTEVRCGEYYVCTDGSLFIGNCSDIGNGEFPIFDASTGSCTALQERININCPGDA